MHGGGVVSRRWQAGVRNGWRAGAVQHTPACRVLCSAHHSRVPLLFPLQPQYHTSPVTSLRFAPRSMLLATAARDGTLALWPLYQPEVQGN